MAELRFISLASKNSLCIPRGRWEGITIRGLLGRGGCDLSSSGHPGCHHFFSHLLLPCPEASIRLSERSPYLWARPTSWMLSLDTRNWEEKAAQMAVVQGQVRWPDTEMTWLSSLVFPGPATPHPKPSPEHSGGLCPLIAEVLQKGRGWCCRGKGGPPIKPCSCALG